MTRYILNRLGQSLVLLVLVSMIGFAVLNLAPGGPLSQFALTPGMTQADLDRISAQMGLDRPLIVQYADWVWRLLRGDWGRSFRDSRPVLDVIGGHFGATLLLMGTATVISVTIGTWVGIKGATKRYSIFDYAATVGAMVALSIPTFWFGLFAIYIFSLKLGWLPAGNMYTIGNGSFLDYAIHLIMPSHGSCAGRCGGLEPLHAHRDARCDQSGFRPNGAAKGMTPRRVLMKHVVGNALLPMITLAGLQVPTLLGGALVTETVFTWPGMGRLFLDSLGYQDYPVVMGLLMFSAILVLLSNLAADLLTAFVDPRIRLT